MWGEYWPQEIEDIHGKMLDGDWVDWSLAAERIADAKKKPIELEGLIQGNRPVTDKDREIAGLVQSCTNYVPSMRLALNAIETTLLDMIERWGGGIGHGEEYRKNISPHTPIYIDSKAGQDAGDVTLLSRRVRTSSDAVLGVRQAIEVSNSEISTESRNPNADDVIQRLWKSDQKHEAYSDFRHVSDVTVDRPKTNGIKAQALHVVHTIGENKPDVNVWGVGPCTDIASYSWSELKLISLAIAEAHSDEDGLCIAKRYHLIDSSGKLEGEAKALMLADGTKAEVRIAGFRHDKLAGGGRAGITFEFKNVPETRHMNSKWTNKGGWKKSEIRGWLNGEFLKLLPQDLRVLIEPAVKWTNTARKFKAKAGAFTVGRTSDRLWLLSMSEVYGHLSSQENTPLSPSTYDAEGVQYQLYADNGVTTQRYEFCKKRGASSWWWLRSPDVNVSIRFHRVYSKGGWGVFSADSDGGVSPGFCF